MAGAGGGAWKVAYADFVTAMMAFFMVMWITSQSPEVKKAVAGYFKDPSSGSSVSTIDTGDNPPPQVPEGMGLTMPEKKLGDQPSPLGLKVLHDGNHRILGTVVTFSEDLANLNAEGQKQLTRLLPSLRGKQNKIEVRGHTTRRPLPANSSFHDKWQLSYARCLAVMTYLEEGGVEPERLRLSQSGPNEPLTISEDAVKQAQNARVEVYVLSEVVDDDTGTRAERAQRFETPKTRD